MGKNITLTEAQFRDLLKTKLNENSGEQFLDYDSTINLLYAVIQNDFKIYFGQKDYVCNSLNDKGEVLEAKKTSDAGDSSKTAFFYREHVFAAMNELRLCADELETITPKEMWPFPSYGDLLFSVR